MDGMNDEANSRYGLRNRKHSNRNYVMSRNKQEPVVEKEDKEEED